MCIYTLYIYIYIYIYISEAIWAPNVPALVCGARDSGLMMIIMLINCITVIHISSSMVIAVIVCTIIINNCIAIIVRYMNLVMIMIT